MTQPIQPQTFTPTTSLPDLNQQAPQKNPDQSAIDMLNATLQTYGISSLSQWAWQSLVNGTPPAQILLELPQQQAFKDEFPEIEMRQKAGLPPVTAGDIVTYRNLAQQYMREAGLPPGFWDQKSDFANLIANNVSLNELQQRVDLARQAVYQMPQAARDVLARDYGITDGHLAANFLDPNQAEPLLQQHFLSAQIGGTAHTTGYDTTRAQNEMLAQLGVTQSQAQSGFNQLANAKQLFQSLPGENTTGISQDDQLAAVFGGNADAQREISQRADQRRAVFGAGGSFAGGGAGAGTAQGA